MKQKDKKLTFGVVNTMAHHRDHLERKCQEIGWMLTGRNQSLLPGNWTDEDAWRLAKSLATLMGQLQRIRNTVFDEDNPYPSQDTSLEDIPYYNPYSTEEPTTPPDSPIELWTEVLHCGILIAASKPDFCFPSEGTFADLEELFQGVVSTGGGPIPKFDHLTDWLWSELTEDHLRKLKEQDYSPEPPKFDDPKDPIEESYQMNIYMEWQEQDWLHRFPCLDSLLQAIQNVNSDHLHGQAMTFINYEIGMNKLLRTAIDLYLYQNGAASMLDNVYYVTYAMLSRTQAAIRKAIAEEEG